MLATVFSQVMILMIMIAAGFVAAKAKIMTAEGARCCTDIALIIATPCVIIKSLIREYSKELMKSLAFAIVITLLVQVLMIVLSRIILHSKDKARERVLRFGTIFANCGFMSLPLQQVILGDDGTLYGSAYVIMFNLVIWSYGVFLISGDKKYIRPKKLFINPGLIGLAIGLVIFIFSVPVPKILYSAIDYMSALYTPLPMLIIGYHLAQNNPLTAFRDSKCLFAVLIRMIIYPLTALGFLYVIGIRGTLLVSVIISVSAPVAAITTMFSSKYGADTPLSVDMVSLSTVAAAVTMPLVITLAQLLA
ncbi:MAG: AEC family transporter [Acutalibacteraceae bacterium]|nr:AEC family transporter [Acutalibacteraceae bacterium]